MFPHSQQGIPKRFPVNSYLRPFSFWSIRSHRFGQVVLIWSIRPYCSVNSYSFWSTRIHFGHLVLMVLVYSFSFWDLCFRHYVRWTDELLLSLSFRRPSSVLPPVLPITHLNDFYSETPGPNFFKPYVESCVKGELKIYTNGHGP